MPPFGRRQFLHGIQLLTSGGLAIARPITEAAGKQSADTRNEPESFSTSETGAVFPQGVASGDPTSSGIVLWTRVAPAYAERSNRLWLQVAESKTFESTTIETHFSEKLPSEETGYTLKTDLDGALAPGTTYWYRFIYDGTVSPTGRTRTAPESDAESLRFAATTCTNPVEGRLNSLERLAERDDIDAVFHHGDYIYEFGNDQFDPPNECVTLSDYRRRYADYRSRPELAAAHQQHPWIVMPDDGDIVNGLWREGAGSHDPDEEGAFETRRAAALQAFHEWIPTRTPTSGPDAISRTLSFGDLADVVVADTRLYRDKPRAGAYATFFNEGVDDPDLQLLSDDQFDWLVDSLADSTAEWTLLAQQEMLGHWGGPGAPPILPEAVAEQLGIRNDGNMFYGWSWNGYPAERRRFYAALNAFEVDGLISLAGDAHLSLALELAERPWTPTRYDPASGRGSLGIEFVVPSVSSDAFAEQFGWPPRTLSKGLEAASLAANPHHRFNEFDSKGYLILELTQEKARAEYWYVDTVTEESDEEFLAAVLESEAGSDQLRLVEVNDPRVEGPLPPDNPSTEQFVLPDAVESTNPPGH